MVYLGVATRLSVSIGMNEISPKPFSLPQSSTFISSRRRRRRNVVKYVVVVSMFLIPTQKQNFYEIV